MEELAIIQDIVKRFGFWAAFPLLIGWLVYKYGIALLPVWIEKIKSDAFTARKRADLEIELMNTKHLKECSVLTSTEETVRTAIPNAIHAMQVAMVDGHASVKAGQERIEAGHERIEKKIDANHARIEQKLESLTSVRRPAESSPSLPS